MNNIFFETQSTNFISFDEIIEEKNPTVVVFVRHLG